MNDLNPRTSTAERPRLVLACWHCHPGPAGLYPGCRSGRLWPGPQPGESALSRYAVFLVGLAMICMGGYVTLNTLWNGKPEKTITADIGYRLVSYRLCDRCGLRHGGCVWFWQPAFPIHPIFWSLAGDRSDHRRAVIIIYRFFLLDPYYPAGRKNPQSEQPSTSLDPTVRRPLSLSYD